MSPFAHRTPSELRSLALQVVSLPGAAFLAVLAAVGDFTPGAARWVVVLGVVVGLAVCAIARFTRLATARFTIGVIVLTMALTTLIGLSIQPPAIGTLLAFVLLGVAVGASAFVPIRLAIAFSAVCLALGIGLIVARSSIPLVACIIFVALMSITVLVVVVLRQSLQAARDEAVALSLADALTGLANRRSMEVNVPLMTALAERTDRQLGCLVLDLDHFKQINDTYGHLVGDGVLQVTADALIQFTRSSDLCVRVGGDEFSVFTIVRGNDELAEVAERLRAAIEGLDATPKTTVSVGGALRPFPSETVPALSLEALMMSADQALYRAKTEGRNAVQIA
ncbi:MULTISPECIES: GGDEF domain-containing protein [Subtercola]|nr:MULTISPECIES: GGDEF domain-containing protein [Subtercola]MEA9985847.1 GGDEF domain-containing protein [Subtercola sp. RTI3]